MWLFDELFLAIKVILRWIIKILNNSVSVAWDNQRQNNHQLLQLSRRNPLSLSLTLTLSMFQFLSISNHVNHKIQQVLQSNLELQRFNEELILWNPGADISLTYWRWRLLELLPAPWRSVRRKRNQNRDDITFKRMDLGAVLCSVRRQKCQLQSAGLLGWMFTAI